jgi:hypothetical protein
MKYLSVVFFAFTAMIMLASPGVMAHSNFIDNVNDSCEYVVFEDTECIGCHLPDDLKYPTPEKDLYLTDGACSFCTEVATCDSVPPTEAELYEIAQSTTKAYFERLFSEFMTALQDEGGSSNPTVFADVFPKCPEIAPFIGSEFSRDTGYLVRRVTTRSRNSRNMPDDWELEHLKKFEKMAADGDPRTLLQITKPGPDGEKLNTMEFEAFEVVKEGVGNDSKFYYRYMRSITMPPMPGADVPNNPNLPCLKCHGTITDLGEGVLEAVQAYYPHDMAMGYEAGDIRGAWTIKIPLASRP